MGPCDERTFPSWLHQCWYPGCDICLQDVITRGKWAESTQDLSLSLLFSYDYIRLHHYLNRKDLIKKKRDSNQKKKWRLHTLSKCILFIWEGQSQGRALWERHLSSSDTSRSTITLGKVQKYTHQWLPYNKYIIMHPTIKGTETWSLSSHKNY